MNEFNSYTNYTHITWVGAVYAFLLERKQCKKCYTRITWIAIEFIP